MRSCYHISVTSDDTVTVIVTSHETYRKTQKVLEE